MCSSDLIIMKKIGLTFLFAFFIFNVSVFSQATITVSTSYSLQTGCVFNFELRTTGVKCGPANQPVFGTIDFNDPNTLTIVDPGAAPTDKIYYIEITEANATCTSTTPSYNYAPTCGGIQAGSCTTSSPGLNCTGTNAYQVQITGNQTFSIH